MQVKINPLKAVYTIILLSFCNAAYAAPHYSGCVSDDNKLRIEFTDSQTEGMTDLKIISNSASKPAEGVFPTRENINSEKVIYTVLDSEFEILTVDISTGKGKLSKAQFGVPNPFVDVTCVK